VSTNACGSGGNNGRCVVGSQAVTVLINNATAQHLSPQHPSEAANGYLLVLVSASVLGASRVLVSVLGVSRPVRVFLSSSVNVAGLTLDYR
jgi:hypothetical protein